MFNRYALAAITAAALLIPDLALAQITVADRLAPGQPPVIIAQRALGAGFPENSLAGIRHAVDSGVDMVKIDIQLTRDGHYVVMHDWTLNRTTDVESVFPDGSPHGPNRTESGGKDYIRNYDLADLERLRLVDGQDGGTHPVPTLDQVLALVDGRALVALGLKMYDVESLTAFLAPRETGNLLFFDIYYADPTLMHDIMAATGIRGYVAMGSSKSYLADLKKLAGALGPDLAMVSVYNKNLTPEFSALAEALGIRVCISGLKGGEDSALLYKDDTAPWRAALDSGAAAFTTAHPAALLELLNR